MSSDPRGTIMKHIFLFAFIALLLSCKQEPVTTAPADGKPTTVTPVKVPVFSKDTAYAMVERQVAFGPRVPGTDAHKAMRQWLVKKLKSYGANVTEQSFNAKTATIGEVRAANVIASFNPTYARRVVLAAHWDTRFAADEDKTGADKPSDGADDGEEGDEQGAGAGDAGPYFELGDAVGGGTEAGLHVFLGFFEGG
jgi:hypothetical protein